MFSTNSMRSMAMSGSLVRLESLMEERLKPGADQAAVDKRIWNLFGETWAVMFTDLSGFSRNVAHFGIVHFLQVIYESQRILTPCIDANDGILLKVEADSMIVIFRDPTNAVNCAVEMQRATRRYNAGRPETEHVLLCLGLGFGPMLRIGDDDVFGTEVNAASKLGEDVAKGYEVLTTGAIKEACKVANVKFQRTDHKVAGTDTVYQLQYSF